MNIFFLYRLENETLYISNPYVQRLWALSIKVGLRAGCQSELLANASVQQPSILKIREIQGFFECQMSLALAIDVSTIAGDEGDKDYNS